MNFSRHKIWQKLKQEINIWRVGAMPGIAVINLVLLLRLTGGLEFFELVVLDNFLRLRLADPMDERILIVGINEEDIRSVGSYPIPDEEIATLIQKLLSYQPAVIGLDIVRDLPVGENSNLSTIFAEFDNIIGVEKVLPDENGFTINPPANLPPEQVGFVDAMLDNDGNLRRSLLSTSSLDGEFKLSLTILLAQKYLATKGYELGNIERDEWGMQFTPTDSFSNNVKKNSLGGVELTRVQPHAGGYINADAGGNQVLLNFRSGKDPFRIVSLNEVKTGKVQPEWIKNRIVLIGITALSAKDIINTPAVDGVNPGRVYGVKVQAHAVSQIISATEDGRPILNFWSDGWEYLWILVWGLLGISLGRVFREPWKILLGLITASVILVGVCYVLLIQGWWIPVVPALLVLFINGAGLTASLFYRYQQDLKLKIRERQLVIDETFQLIHNVPLQTLKQIIRFSKGNSLTNEDLITRLEKLDEELRDIGDFVRQETLTDNGIFIYVGEVKLDLQEPIKEILYQVYSHTIKRSFPYFATIKIKIVKFEDLDVRNLSVEDKRALCRFLEEALCNVGKHARGVTRLKVTCTQKSGKNLIRVEDNGEGLESKSQTRKSLGTRQSENLARKLGGKFSRYPGKPKGTVCELTWGVTKSWFWHF